MEESEETTWASVLRELRKQKGLGVRALAQKSGVAAPSITRFEKGERLITADAAQKLARGLGVDSLALSLAHNLAVLQQKMAAGEEGPRRAVSLARTLLETLENGEISRKQTKTITEALEQLVAILEAHRPRELIMAKSADDDYEAQMLALGRNVFGQRLSDEDIRRRQEEREETSV